MGKKDNDIFRGKVRKYRDPVFKYGSDIINVVHDFVYLRVKSNYNGNLKKQYQNRRFRQEKPFFQ